MLLTDREIVRESTQVTFTMLGDEDPDAVVVEYVDETTWLPANGNMWLAAAGQAYITDFRR
jgi:phenylpyruvate tautomerase PptA (4-oxalocrotonate tautomerase family)